MKVCERIWSLSATRVNTRTQTCTSLRLQSACLTVSTMDGMCAQEICMLACFLFPGFIHLFIFLHKRVVLRPLCDKPGGGSASSGKALDL